MIVERVLPTTLGHVQFGVFHPFIHSPFLLDVVHSQTIWREMLMQF